MESSPIFIYNLQEKRELPVKRKALNCAEFRLRPWKMLIGLFHQTDGRTDDDDDEDDNDELTCQHEAGRKEARRKGGTELEGGSCSERTSTYKVAQQNYTLKCSVFRYNYLITDFWVNVNILLSHPVPTSCLVA